jgi:2-haloacid dehalogenase
MCTIKALFFDVFGTLVDWRSSVSRAAESILAPLGNCLDWVAFADAWRDEYQPAMEEVRSGRLAYAKLDILHRRMLEKILPRFGLATLESQTLDRLTLIWHHLDAWPDVVAGLSRLRQRFRIFPLSNGNIAIMSDIARHNAIQWDAILGADIARDFKPKPMVYLAAVDALNLQPNDCLMCAAHSGDLKAASNLGLRTCFIARPNEHPGVSETAPALAVDIISNGILDLANQLGA